MHAHQEGNEQNHRYEAGNNYLYFLYKNKT